MAESCCQRRQELFLAMVVVLLQLPLLQQQSALPPVLLAVEAVVEVVFSLMARETVLGLVALLLLDEKSCCWLTRRLGWYSS